MKYNLLGVVVFLFSFLLIADTAAQSFGKGRGAGRGDGRQLTGLNLTEDQQTKVDKLRADHRNEVVGLRDELDRLRIDKRQMMRQTDVNKNEYLNLEKKMSSLREKIHLAGAEFRMNVYELLDAEQKEKFSQGNFENRREGRAGSNFGGRGNRNCW
jgi:Spy/CpxP family protein refolding chaperone